MERDELFELSAEACHEVNDHLLLCEQIDELLSVDCLLLLRKDLIN